MSGSWSAGSRSGEAAAADESIDDDCPFDERPVTTKNRHAFWQTRDSIRALAHSSCQNSQSSAEPQVHPRSPSEDVGASEMSQLLPRWACKRSTSVASTHPWDRSTVKPRLSHCSNSKTQCGSGSSDPSPLAVDSIVARHPNPISTIGHPDLQVYCTNTPASLLPLLPVIVAQCEEHVARARQGDWKTRLYSLTLQDVPLTEVPGGRELTDGLTDWVLRLVLSLYAGRRVSAGGTSSDRGVVTAGSSSSSVTMDSYQPHVLKYDSDRHTGAALHFDRCDVTVQLTLSDSSDYDGGGTHFPALHSTIRLERGQLLLHPGPLLHAGCNIRRGTRYLLVWFLHLHPPL